METWPASLPAPDWHNDTSAARLLRLDNKTAKGLLRLVVLLSYLPRAASSIQNHRNHNQLSAQLNSPCATRCDSTYAID
eukprot:2258015-Amphidinium_carterae.1